MEKAFVFGVSVSGENFTDRENETGRDRIFGILSYFCSPNEDKACLDSPSGVVGRKVCQVGHCLRRGRLVLTAGIVGEQARRGSCIHLVNISTHAIKRQQ